MKVAILFDAGSEEWSPQDVAAVVANVHEVRDVLRRRGHEVELLPVRYGDFRWLSRVRRSDLVFNLCEGINGHARFEDLVVGTLELTGVPFTGCRAWPTTVCHRKHVANTLLSSAGVPVPTFTLAQANKGPSEFPLPAIVKPAAEDGSFGIGSDCVVTDRDSLHAVAARGCQQWDRMLVQRFVAGREFNLAIVGDRVLPHAEIDFSRLDPGLPSVVTYAAKWEHGSPEDRGTVPRCPARLPARLATRLTQLARRVWAAVDGTGYGRIDVRVDGRGTTFVTDVNPNPDLGVRAGLSRQAAAAGWSYLDMIARIVEETLTRAERAGGSGPTPPVALANARRLAEGMPYTQRLVSASGRREPRGTRST